MAIPQALVKAKNAVVTVQCALAQDEPASMWQAMCQAWCEKVLEMGASYVCAQPEQGELGNKHLQAFILHDTEKRLNQWLVERIPDVLHIYDETIHAGFTNFAWEVNNIVARMEGTIDHNQEYCTKEATRQTGCVPVELGTSTYEELLMLRGRLAAQDEQLRQVMDALFNLQQDVEALGEAEEDEDYVDEVSDDSDEVQCMGSGRATARAVAAPEPPQKVARKLGACWVKVKTLD